MKKLFIISTLIISFLIINTNETFAKNSLRFISLRADEVNMRTGPSTNNPLKFTYYVKSMPMEVLDEYQGWYKVRDFEGDQGWINKNLISRRQTVILTAEEIMFKKRNTTSKPILRIEEKVVARVRRCVEGWCKLSIQGYEGWVEKANLWGATD
jgi:SH3-like domain-containing protein